MKKLCFLLLCAACTQAPVEPPTPAQVFAEGIWIDLTHPFSDSTLYWPNNKIGFHLDTLFNGTTPGGFFYSSYQFCAPEHGGTHLDAPIHFAAGRWSCDEIPPERLSGNAVVVDVSKKALQNRDYLVSTEDLTSWETENGPLPEGSFLLLRTGYGKFYPDRLEYFGTARMGEEAVAELHFPGLDPQAAEWLVKNRKVKAVGLDTPSIDYGQSKDFKSHQVLLGENILVFENVAHLDQLPSTGAYVMAFPMKIAGGSGGPLRILGWVKK
ncbi:MAG: cyclase family protein [Saprospiraceae bacterium]|nr:cyclase family protein [Saprospiraceae bacterium]